MNKTTKGLILIGTLLATNSFVIKEMTKVPTGKAVETALLLAAVGLAVTVFAGALITTTADTSNSDF